MAAAKLSAKSYFKSFKLTATLNSIRKCGQISDTRDKAVSADILIKVIFTDNEFTPQNYFMIKISFLTVLYHF